MTDLRCQYLGKTLRSPVVASASPLTGQLPTWQALENAASVRS